ncbi:hypothetical protein [Mycoplasmopsis columboralis]|uniref:Uncharacterized protein n=1 Tax=Mycoplasmopsis columboralis TaxID=171282 RepID=A0A449B5S2_9BACT|nr:hypothetical protein [Mycoplasmopsis columboralis]VEU75926.1 Uncharacterised protein [Mycoplasmopsis columboralis]
MKTLQNKIEKISKIWSDFDDFIVQGSWNLKIQKCIEREPNDIDLFLSLKKRNSNFYSQFKEKLKEHPSLKLKYISRQLISFEHEGEKIDIILTKFYSKHQIIKINGINFLKKEISFFL